MERQHSLGLENGLPLRREKGSRILKVRREVKTDIPTSNWQPRAQEFAA